MRRCAGRSSLRLVALDLPGFGLSGALPARRRTLDGYARGGRRLVETLELADAVVVAHEAGALSRRGGRLAAPRDDDGASSFAGAVLVASSPFRTGAGAAPSTLHRFGAGPRLRDAVFAATGRPRLALDALQSRRSSFAASAAGRSTPGRCAPRHDVARWSISRRSPPIAARDATPPSGCSTSRDRSALVWGHRDPLTTPRDFAALERELPYARIWRTEAGHFVQEEEPDAIAEAIEWTVQRIGVAADPMASPPTSCPASAAATTSRSGAPGAPADRARRPRARRSHPRRRLRPGPNGAGAARDDEPGRALRRRRRGAGRRALVPAEPHARRSAPALPPRAGAQRPLQPAGERRRARVPLPVRGCELRLRRRRVAVHVISSAERGAPLPGRDRARACDRAPRSACRSSCSIPSSRAAIAAGSSDHRFATARGDEWIEDPEQPLLAVAFDADWFAGALAAAGLELARPVARGAWRGALDTVSYQDTVVAKKRA